MNMNTRTHIHVTTFTLQLVAYAAILAALWLTPHNFSSSGQVLGKMELHQRFAQAGRIASFGLINRTLTDWYMLGPTEADNIKAYSAIVRTSVVVLTPVFVVWMLVVSWLTNRMLLNSRD